MDEPRGPRSPPISAALWLGVLVLTLASVPHFTLSLLDRPGPGRTVTPRWLPGPALADRPRTAPPFAEPFRAFARGLARENGAEVALYFSDPGRGWAVGLDADRPMYLASGVKLLVMIELFRQAKANQLSLHEKLFYGSDNVRDGAPAMNRRALGKRYPIRELLLYMIRDSDNAATDLLIARLGATRIRAGAIALGAKGLGPIVPMVDIRREVYRRLDPRADRLSAREVRDVRWRDGFHPRLDLLKKHIGPPAGDYGELELDAAYAEYYALGRNHAPMQDIGRLLERLARGELVSASASHHMLALLEHTWTSGRRIEGRLPPRTRVAHKTGTQHERIVDLAILWLPDDSPIVLTIAVKGGERKAMEDIIAAIARDAYDQAHELMRRGRRRAKKAGPGGPP